MSSKLHICAIMILLPFLLFSQQDLNSIWKENYPFKKKSSEKIHDIIWMPDGNLAIVGEVENRTTGRDGLVMVVDSENGEVLDRMVIPGFKDDVLKSIVYGDYSLFAVGYTNKGEQKGQNGWLVELDWNEELTLLRDTTFGTNLNDEFTKVLWTENSTALIAGYSGSYEDSIWLLNWDGKKVDFEKPIGEGICKNLIGLERGMGGKIWLCGNTIISKTKGDIWWVQIDQNGKEYGLDLVGKENGETLRNAARTLQGDLVMVGENLKLGGDSDAWMFEIDANRQKSIQGSFDEKADEQATSILKSPRGNYWMTINSLSMGFGLFKPVTYLSVWDELNAEEPIFLENLTFKKKTEFEAVRLLRTPDNKFILAGNLLKGKNKKSQIHIRAWVNESFLLTKGIGASTLENSEPKWVDKNQDGILSANETGAIKFTLKNIGEEDIPEGNIKITALSKVSGLTILRTNQYLNYLPINGKDPYTFKIKGGPNLAAGTSEFKIEITNGKQTIHQFLAKVKTGQPVSQIPTIASPKAMLGWRKPDVVKTGNRNVKVLENSYEVEVNVNISKDRTVKREDFKVTKNGVRLIDNKNQNGLLSQPIIEDLMAKYIFTLPIKDLEVGENIIEISLGKGEETVPIVINYQPELPNLHVLAIGPTYDDLKFSAKDARDFAETIVQQKGRGFFDKVFVERLVTPDSTEKTKIQIAIKKLAKQNLDQNKDQENHIKSNDYVMFFYSGHGIKRSGKFKLMPTDYNPEYEDDTTIDYKKDVLEPLASINAKVIVFVDACYSGKAKNRSIDKDLSGALLKANRSVAGLITLSSCSEQQYSYEDISWKNGAFTKALLEALKGETVQLSNGKNISADTGLKDEDGKIIEAANNRIVVIGELINFIKIRVEDLVKNKLQEKQTPSVPIENLDKTLHLFTLK